MGTGDATLDAWCASVGKPVMRLPAFVTPAEITELQIVSWNVHVGGGRAETFIQELTGESASHGRGVVLLLQETYRSGIDVPESYPPDLKVPRSIRPRRPAPDIAALAEQFDLFAAYVPSMRNGAATNVSQREDRGNAVLSTEPLTDVTAIELPFGRQRRVAVAATISPRGSRAKPIRVIVFHFDRGDRAAEAEALATRVKALSEAGTMPLVVAGDANSKNGLRDQAIAVMTAQIHREDACGTGRTFRLPLRIDRVFTGRLDFMFSTLDDFGVKWTCQTLRSPMGSDHVPLRMTLYFVSS